MNYVRLYTDADGETHFEELDEQGVDHRDRMNFSEVIAASAVQFRDTEAGEPTTGDWHNAPRRQYVITLEGQTEIEVSDGERRLFKAGDILLVEDTTGKGHRNRTIDDKPKRTVFVRLN
jgi:quercetin dioxygenase-like cupin family protein